MLCLWSLKPYKVINNLTFGDYHMSQESPQWAAPKPAGEKETFTDQINQIIQSATTMAQVTINSKKDGESDIASIVKEIMAWLAAIFYAISKIINACGDRLYTYLKTQITQAISNPAESENSKKNASRETEQT